MFAEIPQTLIEFQILYINSFLNKTQHRQSQNRNSLIAEVCFLYKI